MKNGRPPIYSPELAAAICDRLADGESLRSICRDPAMPDRSVVTGWILNNHEGFTAQYTRAKDIGIEQIADETFDIADDGTNDWIERENQRTGQTYIALNEEAVARSRIRIDQRKWYLSKIAPKKYGDNAKIELTGADNGPVQVEHKGEAIATLLAKAAERKAKQDDDIDGLV